MIFEVNAADEICTSLEKARGESTGVISLQFDADMEDVLCNVSDEDLLQYCVDRLAQSEILDKIGREECLGHFGVDDE